MVQLVDFSIRKASEIFPHSREDIVLGSYQYECARFSALITLRHLLEATDSFHLLSPIGEMIEIDSEIFLEASTSLYGLYEDETDSSEGISKAMTIEQIRENFSEISPKLMFVDMNLGIISTEICDRNRKTWIKSFCSKSCPCVFLSRLNGYSVLMLEDDVRAAWKIIADTHSELKKRINNSGDDSEDSLDFALKCFLDAFPNGKQDATWNVIEEKTGFSRRTINRALAKNGLK